MVNSNIAPMAELDVDDRIAEIEKFLEEQEKKAIMPKAPPKKLEEPIPEDEAITLLKKIAENQELDRKRWERANATENDQEIYDWNEAEVPPGYAVDFYIDVNEGWVLFLKYINITYAADTTYDIWIDNIWEPTLTDSILDFGNHQSYFIPPRKAYTQARITALNNGLITQTYNVFFGGFLRRYRAISREIVYESLEKEKQET